MRRRQVQRRWAKHKRGEITQPDLPVHSPFTVRKLDRAPSQQSFDLVFKTREVTQLARVADGKFQWLERVVEADDPQVPAEAPGAIEHREHIGAAAQADVPDHEFAGRRAHSFREPQLLHVEPFRLGRRSNHGMKRLPLAERADAVDPVDEADQFVVGRARHERSKPHSLAGVEPQPKRDRWRAATLDGAPRICVVATAAGIRRANICFSSEAGSPKSTAGMEAEIIVGNVVFRCSPIHGLGGFARKTLRKGSRIIEYIGKKMDKQEARRRCEAGNVYVFEVHQEWDIDGSVDWNPARSINQSCDANAETDVIKDRVWILAKRTIRAGEEITYNYNFDLSEYEDYPCNCGASQCPGFMVAEEHWEEVRRRHGSKAKPAVGAA